jgi:hypothetical protein
MEARLTLRRLLAILALAGAVATTSACGGGTDAAAAKAPTLLKYSDSNISFTYPAVWRASQPTGPSELHFQPIVYLSTQQVGNPCSLRGNVTSCGWPIKHLGPGGVLALWQVPYSAGVPLGTPEGTQITVGGRQAWRTETAGGSCRQIGADRTIEVTVPSNSISLTVCLRGPNVAQSERRVAALLKTVEFPSQ